LTEQNTIILITNEHLQATLENTNQRRRFIQKCKIAISDTSIRKLIYFTKFGGLLKNRRIILMQQPCNITEKGLSDAFCLLYNHGGLGTQIKRLNYMNYSKQSQKFLPYYLNNR